LLASLRASGEEQDQLVSISPEVDPVAWAAVYPAFDHAASYAFAVAKVSQTHTRNGVIHQLTTPGIEIEKPVPETPR
jgi:hypothetical protein